MNRFTIFAALLAFIPSLPALAQDKTKPKEPKSFAEIKSKAEAGDAKAQWSVGNIYEHGRQILYGKGIEKALTSAEDTAYAVNTLLEEPALAAGVRERRHAWEREVFRAHARTTLETYALVERFRDGPFWSHRLKALESWSQTRRVIAPDSRLTPSDEVREVTTLIRKGRRLVETHGLQLSEETQALQQLHGIEVGAVLELFDTPRTASASIDHAGTDARFYASSRAGISLAIEELVARGFLVEAP